MELRNHTNVSDELIREVVRFVKPSGVSKFRLEVKGIEKSRRYRGRAYMQRNRVLIKINPDVAYPFFRKKPEKREYHVFGYRNGKRFEEKKVQYGKGYLSYLILSFEEALVHIIAHELRHLWQYKHPKGYRVWNAKGRFSERDADAYAIRKVREWRKKTNAEYVGL